MKKVLKIIGLTLIVLCVVGFMGFSGYIGILSADGITYSNMEKDTKDNSIKQLEIWGFDAGDLNDNYNQESLELEASDGNIVPVVYFSSSQDADNNTAIVVHGYGGDYVSAYPQIKAYLELGWNVLAIDQRASGNSTNDKVSFGYYEKLDIMAAVDYARQFTEKKVAVHGISMGGATTGLYSATEHAKDNVDFIIMDSSFDNMHNMYKGIAEGMEVGLPIDYFMWCTNIGLKLKYGYGFKDTDVAEKVKECTIPTLIIQGSNDTLSTPEMGEKIFSNIATEDKEYWLNDTKHIESAINYPVQYKERIGDFIK